MQEVEGPVDNGKPAKIQGNIDSIAKGPKMSNDKKDGNDKVAPLSRQPSRNETSLARHITLDDIGFSERPERVIRVQNSLPPPEPIKKK